MEPPPGSSNLYFNQQTIFGTTKDSDHVFKSEFVEKVDWFLKLFRGPYLNTFTVDFCLDNESASAIDNWISFSVSMGTESIELDFNTSESQNLYKFPFHLLTGYKSRLKHLKLSACHLLLTPHSPFNWLKTIELKYLPLDQTSLDGLMCSCLDLEWLTLEECELPRTVRVRSARLRGLRLFLCWKTKTIELDAAQLQEFEFKGRWLKLSFLVVPPLQRVHFGSLDPCTAEAFFDLLPENVPARIPEFSCLKQLEFFSSQHPMEMMEFDLLSITRILNACPPCCRSSIWLCLNLDF